MLYVMCQMILFLEASLDIERWAQTGTSISLLWQKESKSIQQNCFLNFVDQFKIKFQIGYP